MITYLRRMSPQEVCSGIAGFSAEYHDHWQEWLAQPSSHRAACLGSILRRWQATRPQPSRRLRSDNLHPPPFLEDLMQSAQAPMQRLGPMDMRSLNSHDPQTHADLCSLWTIFRNLTYKGEASCVGISKAVLLLSDGRIGPALDSTVRAKLGIQKPMNAEDWVRVLHDVADDLRAFEKSHGILLEQIVPERYRNLAVGRLYDMVGGPREKSTLSAAPNHLWNHS